jgi:hypothetical protein
MQRHHFVLVQNVGTLDRVTDVAQKRHCTVQAPLTLVPVHTCCLSVLRINHIAGPFKPDPMYDLTNHVFQRMAQMRSLKVMATIVIAVSVRKLCDLVSMSGENWGGDKLCRIASKSALSVPASGGC